MRKRLIRSYRSLTARLRVLPDFIIIGATRSGTTSLYQDLIRHPCVVPAYRKEPSYFNHYYGRGIDWYKSQFPFSLHKRYFKNVLRKEFQTGEATANYFYYPSVPQKIAEALPDIRLILLLRNPVERAYSDYQLTVRSRRESRSFEEAIDDELKNPVKVTPENERSLLLVRYLLKGVYADHLAVWLKFFKKEQLLVLKSEEFFRGPSATFRQVLNHLGLPNWEPLEYAVFKEPGRTTYAGKYEGGNYPRMIPETRARLLEFFSPHNQRLYDMLGSDFHWEDQS
jgi:hypothetical protein